MVMGWSERWVLIGAEITNLTDVVGKKADLQKDATSQSVDCWHLASKVVNKACCSKAGLKPLPFRRNESLARPFDPTPRSGGRSEVADRSTMDVYFDVIHNRNASSEMMKALVERVFRRNWHPFS